MPNATTDHSKDLRKRAALARRRAIKAEGGKDLSNILLEKHDVRRLEAVCQWKGSADTPATQTDVIRKLIRDAFARIPQPDLTEADCDAAFGAGAVACSNGIKRSDNPYIEGTALYQEWESGWRQYDADYNPDYYSSPLGDDL